MLVLLLNVKETANLYFGDYKSLVNNQRNHQFIQLQYFNQDYQDYLNLFIAVQNKYFIITNLLTLAYLATNIYGLVLLIGFSLSQVQEKIIVTLMIISSINLLFKLLMFIGRNKGKDKILSKSIQYQKQSQDICTICLIEYKEGEQIEELVCQGKHLFHGECIHLWLRQHKVCPICKFIF
ncbi:hypothetical protein pb186bvf_001169 [Paramecium bursaria]